MARKPKPTGTKVDLTVGRQEKRVLTNEPWYPTRADGTIRVSVLPLSDGRWRVCLWGEDDFGLEKDFDSRMEAREMFERITNLVTQEQLYSWGFIHA